MLQTLVQEPTSPARASILWMHGLGATAHDFESVPPELRLPPDFGLRFVFPQAPSQPITINGGLHMPAWYDIRSLDGSSRAQDLDGIRRSEARIAALIEREEERGIPAHRIVVGGFSQGGAMALHTALRYPRRLAGVMVLSGYLLAPDILEDEASDANRDLPVFQAHGTHDPMVRFAWAEGSRQTLERHGWSVESHQYPMGHQVCLEEIRAIGTWLRRVLAPEETA